jgi:hypothetical protein
MATSRGGCASRLSRKNVIGDVVCLLMRRHLCVIPAPIVATTSSGLITPAPSNPSCVLPTLSPSTPSVLSLHRANRLCSFFLRILLHRSTSRSLNLLCCRRREIGSLADTGTYLQDSDPKHTAKLTQDWLRAHVPEYFTREQWPPRSPDLNPIENAWALVASQASLRQPKTLEELKHAVRGAWTKVMTEEYCTTLADSMDARLRTLRKLRGAHTGY